MLRASTVLDCAAQEQARAKAAAVIAGRKAIHRAGPRDAVGPSAKKIRGLGIGKDTGTSQKVVRLVHAGFRARGAAHAWVYPADVSSS